MRGTKLKQRRREHINRGSKEPQPAKPGFIQAPDFLNEEIRRASEQTSPQVARAAGQARKRAEGGGLSSGSSSIRRFQLKINNLGWDSQGAEVGLSFTGEHTQKVDGKGRMSIPADFRRVLEAGDPEWTSDRTPRMYLLYGDHLEHQLHGYTVNEFNALDAQIQSLPRGSDARRKLSRLILGQSMKLDIDKDGRAVMPIRQRQKLGVTEGELYFSGMGDHFEIWKAETFQAQEASEMQDWLAEMPDGFDPLSLLGDG